MCGSCVVYRERSRYPVFSCRKFSRAAKATLAEQRLVLMAQETESKIRIAATMGNEGDGAHVSHDGVVKRCVSAGTLASGDDATTIGGVVSRRRPRRDMHTADGGVLPKLRGSVGTAFVARVPLGGAVRVSEAFDNSSMFARLVRWAYMPDRPPPKPETCTPLPTGRSRVAAVANSMCGIRLPSGWVDFEVRRGSCRRCCEFASLCCRCARRCGEN